MHKPRQHILYFLWMWIFYAVDGHVNLRAKTHPLVLAKQTSNLLRDNITIKSRAEVRVMGKQVMVTCILEGQIGNAGHDWL